jgi:hypothetical protein
MKDLDLTPLAEEWFAEQFASFVMDDERRLKYISFDVKVFSRFVINYVYDYQNKRQWGAVTCNTARIVNYDDRSIRKIRNQGYKVRFGT